MEVVNEIHEEVQQQTQSGNLDEWGKFIGNTDFICISEPGVLQAIRDKNQAITSCAVELMQNEIDWEEAGQIIGNSKLLKHLIWRFRHLDVEQELDSFCRGIASNKSIQSWHVYAHGGRAESADMFRHFIPFCTNNSNLQSIAIDLDSTTFASAACVIRACRSLKSIALRNLAGRIEMSQNIEETVQAICEANVKHVSFTGLFLTRDSCQALKSYLSDQTCALSSLKMKRVMVNDSEDIIFIGNGVAANNSVKHLTFNSPQKNVSNAYLESLKHKPLNALESCIMDDYWKKTGPYISPVIQQMPNLKSLSLSSLNFEATIWREIFSALPLTISKLKLTGGLLNNAILLELTPYILSNTSLKVLNLSSNYRVSTAGWSALFNSMRGLRLEELYVHDTTIIGPSLADLSDCVSSMNCLRFLKTPKWIANEHGGLEMLQTFASMIVAHTSIEKDDIVGFVFHTDGMCDVANHSMLLSGVKNFCLSVKNAEQLQNVANALAAPNSPVLTLKLNYIQAIEDIDIDRDVERTQLTSIIVSALENNSSLKTLQFHYCGQLVEPFQLEWSMFQNLLCNTSTIVDTMNSNHVLQEITGPGLSMPIEIRTLLYINRTSNKRAVAREKVIQSHKLEEINFTGPLLPLLLSRMGQSNSIAAFSHAYGILRRSPQDIVQNRNRKRKSEEIIHRPTVEFKQPHV